MPLSVSYDNNTITVTNSETTTSTAPVIFLVQADDYGDFTKYRNSSAAQDYLDTLREGWITLNFPDDRLVQIGRGVGSNYSSGIPLKLNEDQSPAVLTAGESIDITLVKTNTTPIRVGFEVM